MNLEKNVYQKHHDTLLSALGKNTGLFMRALAQGANPEYLDQHNRSIGCHSLFENPVYIAILLRYGLDANSCFKDRDGTEHPLLLCAMQQNKSQHAQVLLDAGATPYLVESN